MVILIMNKIKIDFDGMPMIVINDLKKESENKKYSLSKEVLELFDNLVEATGMDLSDIFNDIFGGVNE